MEHPALTESEERDLHRAAQAGDDDARERLVLSCLRLVERRVRTYHRSVRELGFSADDLRGVGLETLVGAVDKFDPSRGRLTTLVDLWVELALRNYVADNIRLFRPSDRAKKAEWRINALRVTLAARNGRQPSNEVVARELAVHHLDQKLGRPPTEEEIEQRLPFAREWIEVMDRSNGPVIYFDRIPAEGKHPFAHPCSSPPPDAVLAAGEMTEIVEQAVSGLPERDAEIVRLYFGLKRRRLTMDEIAPQFGVSRERIRQILRRSIGRLGEGEQAGVLRDLYEELS